MARRLAMACSNGEGPGVRKAAAGSCNELEDTDGAAAGAKASPWTAKGSELTDGAEGGWPNGSEKAEPFDEIEGAAGAAKGSAPRLNEEATDGALGAPSKDDATEDTDGGAGGAPKGSGVAGAGGTEPLRRCGLAWAGEALGSVDELLRVPSPLAAKRLRAAGGAEGGTRPGPDEATDGAEAVPKGSEKALEVDGAGAGADHSAWRRRAISSSVSAGAVCCLSRPPNTRLFKSIGPTACFGFKPRESAGCGSLWRSNVPKKWWWQKRRA